MNRRVLEDAEEGTDQHGAGGRQAVEGLIAAGLPRHQLLTALRSGQLRAWHIDGHVVVNIADAHHVLGLPVPTTNEVTPLEQRWRTHQVAGVVTATERARIDHQVRHDGAPSRAGWARPILLQAATRPVPNQPPDPRQRLDRTITVSVNAHEHTLITNAIRAAALPASAWIRFVLLDALT